MGESITRPTASRKPRTRCTCDSIGSGVCPVCQGIIERKATAAARRRGVTVPPPVIVAPPRAVDTAAERRSDIADRLTAAARLIESGVYDLDATARLVSEALGRIERLTDEQATLERREGAV